MTPCLGVGLFVPELALWGYRSSVLLGEKICMGLFTRPRVPRAQWPQGSLLSYKVTQGSKGQRPSLQGGSCLAFASFWKFKQARRQPTLHIRPSRVGEGRAAFVKSNLGRFSLSLSSCFSLFQAHL